MTGLGDVAIRAIALLHLVDQGLRITGITGIPHRGMQGKDEASRRLGNDAGFAAKLRRAVAFTLTNGGNGRVIGVDDFAVGHRFTLRQPPGLLLDPVMGGEGGW